MEMFETPVVLHEIAREPIEQFGMRRRVALHSEIFRRAHETGAEVSEPNAVYHHARSGWGLLIGEPFREGEARAVRIFRQRMQECRRASGHRLLWLEPITAAEQ